jgi:hypothetical protein
LHLLVWLLQLLQRNSKQDRVYSKTSAIAASKLFRLFGYSEGLEQGVLYAIYAVGTVSEKLSPRNYDLTSAVIGCTQQGRQVLCCDKAATVSTIPFSLHLSAL